MEIGTIIKASSTFSGDTIMLPYTSGGCVDLLVIISGIALGISIVAITLSFLTLKKWAKKTNR